MKVIEDLPLNNRGGGREGKVYVILPFGEYKNWDGSVAGINNEKLGNLSLKFGLSVSVILHFYKLEHFMK